MANFAIDFYDQQDQCLPSMRGWTRACTVEEACRRLAVDTGIPQEHLGLFPRHRPLTLCHALDANALLRPYKHTGVSFVDKRTFPPDVIDAAYLSFRLPHISESARHQLLERLRQFKPGQLDLGSIRERPSGVCVSTACASGLYSSVAIFSRNPTMPQTSVVFQGEAMFPFRLLPDEGGVEFRSGYTYEYRALAEEDRLAHAELLARIAHCEKLLTNLPIALKNSRAAMKEHSKSEEVNLNTLGAIYMEQERIDAEIVCQGTRLKQLEAQVATAKANFPSTSKLFKHQTAVTLPFGPTKMGGDCVYWLRAIDPFLPSRMSEAVPTAIVCE